MLYLRPQTWAAHQLRCPTPVLRIICGIARHQEEEEEHLLCSGRHLVALSDLVRTEFQTSAPQCTITAHSPRQLGLSLSLILLTFQLVPDSIVMCALTHLCALFVSSKASIRYKYIF